MGNERITVLLPSELLGDVDRIEQNRSKFVREAIERELVRRRRSKLRRSLRNPHRESHELAELGFQDWVQSLPSEDALDLLDQKVGKPVRWKPGRGWIETDK